MDKVKIKNLEYKCLGPALNINNHKEHGTVFTNSDFVWGNVLNSEKNFPIFGFQNVFLLRNGLDKDVLVPEVFRCRDVDIGFYNHYRSKEHEYLVVGVALDVSSYREFVLYRPMYDAKDGLFKKGDLLYRVKNSADGVDAFVDNVVKPQYDYEGPRFNFLRNY